jgi:hypothetical protein
MFGLKIEGKSMRSYGMTNTADGVSYSSLANSSSSSDLKH